MLLFLWPQQDWFSYFGHGVVLGWGLARGGRCLVLGSSLANILDTD